MCVCLIAFLQYEKGLRNHVLIYSRSISSVFLSIHLSVCLPSPTSCHLSIRAASSPNLVASRSQMPPQYLTVRYVPAFLKGGVSHYNQVSPLPAALLAAISPGFFLSKSTLCLCLFGNEWVSVFNEVCFHTCGSYSCYNVQLDCKASTRVSRMQDHRDCFFVLRGQRSSIKMSYFFRFMPESSSPLIFLFLLDFQQAGRLCACCFGCRGCLSL